MKIKLIQQVSCNTQSGQDSVHRWMDTRPVGQMDRQTKWNQYTPFQICGSGSIINWRLINKIGKSKYKWSETKFANVLQNQLSNAFAWKKRLWILYANFNQTLQWRHNEHDGISNHQHPDCLLSCLLRRRSRKTSKLCVTGLCEGNPPVTGGLPVTQKIFPFDNVIKFVPRLSRDLTITWPDTCRALNSQNPLAEPMMVQFTDV